MDSVADYGCYRFFSAVRIYLLGKVELPLFIKIL